MPPKGNTEVGTIRDNEDFKLVWFLLAGCAKGGKLEGVDWEQIRMDLNLPTTGAAIKRWSRLKEKMVTQGLAFTSGDAENSATATGESSEKPAKKKRAPKAGGAKAATSGTNKRKIDEVDEVEGGDDNAVKQPEYLEEDA